jgi:hypothetical protein
MSGLQRIGVVISVLWIVGLVGGEYFSIANYNSRESAEYGECRSNALSEKNPSQRQAHEQSCDRMHNTASVSFGDDLSRAANDPWIWFILFAPIAALWIVVGTLRWIGRGFRAREGV